MSDSPYSFERDEWKSALRADRFTECSPGSHRMTPVRGGGGVCVHCGFVVDGEEL